MTKTIVLEFLLLCGAVVGEIHDFSGLGEEEPQVDPVAVAIEAAVEKAVAERDAYWMIQIEELKAEFKQYLLAERDRLEKKADPKAQPRAPVPDAQQRWYTPSRRNVGNAVRGMRRS